MAIQEPALDERPRGMIAFGMEALASEPDLLVLGEMGVGMTAAAPSVMRLRRTGGGWVGGWRRRRAWAQADAVRATVARHKPYLDDPLRFWRALGARNRSDCGRHLARAARQCCSTASWCARQGGAAGPHDSGSTIASPPMFGRARTTRFKLESSVRFRHAAGRGSGAALAVKRRAAVACHNGMATFAAGVARKQEA